jgi:Ca2+-dependent lipid-binding protein
MSAWPHIKTLELGFVSQPDIDFTLKPLGADLSKLAGLGTFIKETVDGQLKQIVVNPNKITLPINEWMDQNATSTDIPVGVLRVMVRKI